MGDCGIFPISLWNILQEDVLHERDLSLIADCLVPSFDRKASAFAGSKCGGQYRGSFGIDILTGKG
jgi:hypothetical protein